RRARDVEDDAALLRLEARHDLLRGKVDRLHVDGEDAVEVGLVERLERLRQVAHAGVVDEDVEAVEALDRGPDHRLDVGGPRHVGADAFGVRAERVGDPARAVAVAVGDDHARALGDELPGDALAESRGRTGDDGDLSCESHGALLVVKVSERRRQPCWMAIVFSVEKPYSASKPFSRPWPECLTPPNGSSMPPAAP